MRCAGRRTAPGARSGSTRAMIIERGSGTPGWARWSWRCPSCGSAATSGLAVDLLAAGRAGPGVGRRDELSAGCVDPAGGEAGRAARCGRRCPRARSRRWPSTSMDAGPYTFVWLDASTVKVREGGRTVAWSGGTHPRGGPVRQRLTWPGSARAEPANVAAAAHCAAGGAHSHHRCHNGAGGRRRPLDMAGWSWTPRHRTWPSPVDCPRSAMYCSTATVSSLPNS